MQLNDGIKIDFAYFYYQKRAPFNVLHRGRQIIGTALPQKRREYKQLVFHDGESVEDFAMRFTSLTNQLVMLGDAMPDDKIVAKYLRVARLRY
jgi:hypothetical protein